MKLQIMCMNYTILPYFFVVFLVFNFDLTSFFLVKIPLSVQSNPLWFPQPSSSFNVTEEVVKLNCNIQGSPPCLKMAVLEEVNKISPFNSPVHSPSFFSTC